MSLLLFNCWAPFIVTGIADLLTSRLHVKQRIRGGQAGTSFKDSVSAVSYSIPLSLPPTSIQVSSNCGVPSYVSASKRYGIYWSMIYWKTNIRLGLPSPSTGSIAFFPVSSVAYWVCLQPQWWSAIARRQTMDSLGFLILRTRGLKIRCFSS